MALKLVGPGKSVPRLFNVIIEIPAHSDPIKYEVDKETGALFVDRFMSTAMHYPCNYGYIPQTLSDDGDPVDVLLITPFPVAMGAVVRSRALGLLKMEDEAGNDSKILAVPVTKVLPTYKHLNEVRDINPDLLAQIKHFFLHYKDLEAGKKVLVKGWSNKQQAEREIERSCQRYLNHLDS
ncbi:MAG: inorganic diphosphatase [Burkholderiaceae bacterium]|nr:MAG: inorganic diphosphatase [Burkholderiaceae bacterium]